MSLRAHFTCYIGIMILLPPIQAHGATIPTNPPRDQDEKYEISHHLLGTVITNTSPACGAEVGAAYRSYQAKYDLGYRWVRHANMSTGFARVVEDPPYNAVVTDIDFRTKLWPVQGCPPDSMTNAYAWWCDLYSVGTYNSDPLYMHQIGRLDLYGPGGAGWTWESGDPLIDPDNGWTGDFFALTGLFHDPIADGEYEYSPGVEFDIDDVWESYASKTAQLHGIQADTTNGEFNGTFKRWMVFNEPFLRGLFPNNIVDLFELAKDAIREEETTTHAPVYIGGVSGAKTMAVQGSRKSNKMTQLERHFALAAYGSVLDGEGGNLNESLGIHIYDGGPPESKFSTVKKANGLLDKCNSIFSLGRFWGMNPVLVTLDEAAVTHHPSDSTLTNPEETQANYLERTLILSLASGYLDGVHLAVMDICDPSTGGATDRPGIATHAAAVFAPVDTIKPAYNAAMAYDKAMGTAAFESALALPDDPYLYAVRFRSAIDPDTTVTALWSADPVYDGHSGRDDIVQIQVQNNDPFDVVYRVPSDSTNIHLLCNNEIKLPADPGSVAGTTVTPTTDGGTGWKVTLPLGGAPIYLRSATNQLVADADEFRVSTLAGLKTVQTADRNNIFELTFKAEHDYTEDDTISFVLPTDWISPQIASAASSGYVTVAPASRSLPDLTLATDGQIIHALPQGDVRAGAQFSVLYGDCRAQSVLLDMGPWSSGPVDLDFLKMENWMTFEADFSYNAATQDTTPY